MIGALTMLLAVGSAQGADFEGELAMARQALAQDDVAKATSYMATVQADAAANPAVVLPRALALIWLYRGVIAARTGADEATVMEAWRQALVLDNDLGWDNGAMDDGDRASLFEALRGEVQYREKVGARVPEAVGRAQLFVDGRRVQAGDEVLAGTHLAQITCDDGTVHGMWTEFKKKVDWLGLCPGGVDLTAAPVEEESDEWAEFGPAFAPTDEVVLAVPDPTLAEAPTPEPAPPAARPAAEDAQEDLVLLDEDPGSAEEEPDLDLTAVDVAPAPAIVEEEPPVAAEAPAPAPAAEEPNPNYHPITDIEVAPNTATYTPVTHRRSNKGARVGLLTTGGLMAAGAGGVWFAMLDPTWGQIQDARAAPESLSRADADALTSRYNVGRGLFFGLVGASLGLVTTGVLVDAPITPWMGLSGGGLSGSF